MVAKNYIFGRKYNADLISGLIHAWKFEETSGNIAFDSIGSSNMTLVNGVLINQTGKVGKAVSFDGVNDYAYALISNTYPFAFKFWVNNVDASVTKVLIGGSNSVGLGVTFYKGIEIVQIGNKILVRFGDGFGNSPGNRRDYITDSVCLSNGWSQVFINIVSFGVVEIYVNGILYANSYLSGTAIFANLSSYYTRPMAATPSATTYSGTIDEFFIYNVNKTASQILRIYNLENAGNSII